jgi:hypothetical protein
MTKLQDKERVKVRKKVQTTDSFLRRVTKIEGDITNPKEREQALRDAYFNEAMRYMDNAKETLKKAAMEGEYYTDTKYVKTACGTAYCGVLIALDGYFYLKGVKEDSNKTKDVHFYRYNASKFDRKMLIIFNSVYATLHCYGYYDGQTNSKQLKIGFEEAKKIINYVKPRT